MINHFWNLCRTCPTTGYDKDLHSEYRSTYKWHEYSPSTQVVRIAPRRKAGVVGGVHETSDAGFTRTRMSQPPPTQEKTLANGSAGGFPSTGVTLGGGRGAPGVVTTIAPKASATQESKAPPSGQLQEKILPQESTQQQQQQPQTPPMESEMEGEDKFMKRTYKSEYRKKFRPFSQYQYVDGKFHKSKQDGETGNTWYKEVLELRKQAGQYRCRGWGVETASDRMAEIYTKQVELWEQVSRRSSLQALSLASAAPSRPISKAEKEIENSRRSSPIKHARERPSTAPAKQKPAAVHKPPAAADKTDGKPQKESTTPRHHYEKTTGSGDGFFITSPSRDRIEPVISSDLATRRSPRKTPPVTSPVKEGIANKRRAPRAISVARTSTAKESKPPNKSSPSIGKAAVSSSSAGKKADIVGRSVSVGPENRSPKRTSRPPSSTHPPAPATKERRPRPTSLTTSSRRKGADSAIPHHEAKKTTKKPHDISASPKRSADLKSRDEKRQSSDEDVKKDGILKESFKEAAGRKSTPEPRFDPEKYEPVVKTPPEPTRVKSPDQVMVKSPDPVNWTVPLDTGKTFTVTSNVPEGEASRGTPSSEHRPPLESRSRQTPEPTKVYQGSLAGTPITTAGTTSSAPSASTATATIVSTSSHLPSKTEPVSTVKTTSSSIPSSVSAADIPKEPVSGVGSDSSLLPSSNIKPVDDKKTNELPTEISSLSTASKPLDSKSLSSIKETSPQPSESPKPYQELPKPSEVLEAKSSPASSLSSSVGLSSGPAADPMTMSVFGSLNGMNGKSSGTPSPTKPEVSLLEMTTKGVSDSESQSVSASFLKCLDDPNFLDNDDAPSTIQKTSPGYKILDAPLPETSVHSKPGSYRVLEAPEDAPLDKQKDIQDHSPTQSSEVPSKSSPYRVLEAPVEPPSRPKGSPYRVLEAPDAPFPQASQPVGASTDSMPPSLVSPSSGRTVTDALDKARSRFDSFWGGGKDKDPPSKV